VLLLVQRSINIEFTVSKNYECSTFVFLSCWNMTFLSFSIIESHISYTKWRVVIFVSVFSDNIINRDSKRKYVINVHLPVIIQQSFFLKFCTSHIILSVRGPIMTNNNLLKSFFQTFNLFSMTMVEADLVGATESNFNKLKLLN